VDRYNWSVLLLERLQKFAFYTCTSIRIYLYFQLPLLTEGYTEI